jgi:hypothetical protein
MVVKHSAAIIPGDPPRRRRRRRPVQCVRAQLQHFLKRLARMLSQQRSRKSRLPGVSENLTERPRYAMRAAAGWWSVGNISWTADCGCSITSSKFRVGYDQGVTSKSGNEISPE